MRKDDVVKKVALGASGVVLTAGAVAAGAILANQNNRKNISKLSKKGIKTFKRVVRDIKIEIPQGPQVTSHRIKRARSKRQIKRKNV